MTRKPISAFALSAAALLGSSASAGVMIFDDALYGATTWGEGNPKSEIVTAPEPVYAGTSSLKAVTTGWNQCGIQSVPAIPVDAPILETMFYRTSGSSGNFAIRYGGSWTTRLLDDTNTQYWTVDGVNGVLGSTDQWHTLQVDIKGLLGDISSIKAFGFKGNGGTDTFYFDNIGWVAVPEPAFMGVIGVSGLAMLRRRRTA